MKATPWTRILSLAMTLVVGTSAFVACGDDDDGAAPTSTEEAAAPCVGEPLRFTTIVTRFPTGGGLADQLEPGLEVAVEAANRECELGRPIELTICDDHADPNENLACGREAKESESLAFIYSVGSVDSGAKAADLPGVMLAGTGAFDLTNPKAYSAKSGVLGALSTMSAAKAYGAETFTSVFLDIPAIQFVVAQLTQLATILDMEFKSVLVPEGATDYAPFAAQVAAGDPDAVAFGVTNGPAMLKALAGEGITPDAMPVITAGGSLTPNVLEEMGDGANGLVVVAQELPISAESNSGIAQIRADFEAAGVDPDDSDHSFLTVGAWGAVHYLVEALAQLDDAAIAALDSQGVVDAVVAASPFTPAEAAPFDFRQTVLGDQFPAMAALRFFTSSVAFLRFDAGEFLPLSDGFVSLTDPPDLSEQAAD